MQCGVCGSSRLLGPVKCQQGSAIQVDGVDYKAKTGEVRVGKGRFLVESPDRARICLDCGHYMRFFKPEVLAALAQLPDSPGQ